MPEKTEKPEPPARRAWTVPGDVLNRIVLDISGGITPDDSVLLYNEEMLDFRKIVAAEWEAHRASHPGAILHVPDELPSANIASVNDDEDA